MRLCICLIGMCLGVCFFGHADFNKELSDSEFYSQAAQDKFVYTLLYGLLDKQDAGCYLEIGSGEPIYINNSYFFEKNLNWTGVSIDVLAHDWYSSRKNPLLLQDATQVDYDSLLQSFPPFIDYLSLDIDSEYDTVLKRIPFNEHIFKIITIEHDFYRYGNVYRDAERAILTSFGYYLLCPDVSNGGNIYEDWWIYPNAFPADVFSALTSLDLNKKEHTELFQIIQTVVKR